MSEVRWELGRLAAHPFRADEGLGAHACLVDATDERGRQCRGARWVAWTRSGRSSRGGGSLIAVARTDGSTPPASPGEAVSLLKVALLDLNTLGS